MEEIEKGIRVTEAEMSTKIVGPGRTRTSNQIVMSGRPKRKRSTIVGRRIFYLK